MYSYKCVHTLQWLIMDEYPVRLLALSPCEFLVFSSLALGTALLWCVSNSFNTPRWFATPLTSVTFQIGNGCLSQKKLCVFLSLVSVRVN